MFARNSENKTAKDLADMATESDTVQFLASCETGLIPDTAPKKKVGCHLELDYPHSSYKSLHFRRELPLNTRRLLFLLDGALANIIILYLKSETKSYLK